MKTIDVHAKEWFDKVNGNSYFAATIIIDFGLSSEKTVKVNFSANFGRDKNQSALAQECKIC